MNCQMRYRGSAMLSFLLTSRGAAVALAYVTLNGRLSP